MLWLNRSIAVVCLSALVVSFIGCGPDDQGPNEPGSDGNSTQAATSGDIDPANQGDLASADDTQVGDGQGSGEGEQVASGDSNANSAADTGIAAGNDNTASSDSGVPTSFVSDGSDDTSDAADEQNGETVIPRDPITGRPLPPAELTGGEGQKTPEKKVKTLDLKEIPKAKATGKRLHFVTFDDLVIGMKQDQKFEPNMLTQKVVDLNNQRVKIQGFIFPALPIAKGIKEFPLVKNTECKYGPGGTAHHLVDIKMAKGVTVDYTTRIVTVEGVLTIKPFEGFDGNTWSIYEMKCDKAY